MQSRLAGPCWALAGRRIVLEPHVSMVPSDVRLAIGMLTRWPAAGEASRQQDAPDVSV